MGNKTEKEFKDDENSLNYPIDEKIKNEAYELEKELLNKFCHPLTNKEVYYKDIPISFNGDSYLHTLIYDEENLLKPNYNSKKILIMLHGFQACSLTYYRLIPLIKDKFIVICPDLIGMGLSSRPKIQFKSTEECINFFVESLEKFRQSLNINKFYLCGHSLGGYFAGQYAIKYPQYLEDNILLFSPTGIGDEKKGGDTNENLYVIQKLIFKGNFGLFHFKPTLREFYQKFLISNIIDKILSVKYEIPKEEGEYYAKIKGLGLKYPKDLDDCVYFIFKYPFPTPIIPLEELFLKKIPEKNIIFCYGEKDWMDTFGAKRLNKINEQKYKFFTIKNSGHTWPLENIEEGAKIINEELLK
jgi:pimeloyl-ACP methyl ester carboxylesterase